MKFLLEIDHSALRWIFNFNGSNRRLVRWSLELQPYRDFMTIKHKAGKKHFNVDPLSRAPLARCDVVSVVKPPMDFIETIKAGHSGDNYFKQVIESSLADTLRPEFDRFSLRADGLLLFIQPGGDFTRICVPDVTAPENLRLSVIGDHHDVISSGRLGIAKTTNSVCRHFYWPHMTIDFEDYVRSCMQCQLKKPATKSYGPHQPLPTPAGRWHTVTMDFAGPFARSCEGQWDMVIIVVDKFSSDHTSSLQDRQTLPRTPPEDSLTE